MKISIERLESVMLSQNVSMDELSLATTNGLEISGLLRRYNGDIPVNLANKIVDYLNCDLAYLSMETNEPNLKEIKPDPVPVDRTHKTIYPGYIKNEIITDRLEARREFIGFSCSNINELIVNDTYSSLYCNIKTHKVKQISLDVVNRLCYYLQTDLDYLIGETDFIDSSKIPALKDLVYVESHVILDRIPIKRVRNKQINDIVSDCKLSFNFVKSSFYRRMRCSKRIAEMYIPYIKDKFNVDISYVDPNAESEYNLVSNDSLDVTAFDNDNKDIRLENSTINHNIDLESLSSDTLKSIIKRAQLILDMRTIEEELSNLGTIIEL